MGAVNKCSFCFLRFYSLKNDFQTVLDRFRDTPVDKLLVETCRVIRVRAQNEERFMYLRVLLAPRSSVLLKVSLESLPSSWYLSHTRGRHNAPLCRNVEIVH